jgi:hypothetical protein
MRSIHVTNQASRRQSLRRRALLQLGGLGTAALAMGVASASATAAGGTDALLLNCIDYRLVGRVTRYMTAHGLDQRYDQIVLAGAGLAAVHPAVPAWNQTFWDHVQIALDLHSISRVMVMNHRDCGAFQVLLGQDYGVDPQAETTVHAYYLDLLRQQLNTRYPQLGVELLLMSLDGSVANLT